MLHELVHLNRVVVLVVAMDGKANGTDKAAVFAVGINANEGRVLAVGVAVVGFDEVSEALGKLLNI